MDEQNTQCIESLKLLNESLTIGNKQQLFSVLDHIKDYLIGYEPELWDLTIQGVLMDLFFKSGKERKIYELVNKSKIILTEEEKKTIEDLGLEYKEVTEANGKMRYILKEPIGTFENPNRKRTEERVSIGFELVKHNYDWFVKYHGLERPEPDKKVFDEHLLSAFHKEFDGELWENIDLSVFLDSIYGKIENKIRPRIQKDFCIALGCLQPRFVKGDFQNVAKWVESTLGIKGFNNQKKDNSTKDSVIKQKNEIKSRIDSLLKQNAVN